MISAAELWKNHPAPNKPCDTTTFPNQCAIRMGVALALTGVKLDTFSGARCYPGFKHSPRHILRAHELAKWLSEPSQIPSVGKVRKIPQSKLVNSDYLGKKGVVFLRDGWGATDHIDVFNGKFLKGGSPSYWSLGKDVWLWVLS